MAKGWIYVLTNEHMPGLVKIGQTANEPHIRASELHTTGVPSAFEIEYKGLYEDYIIIERSVHRALSTYRVSSNREFFRIDVAEAIVVIRKVAPSAPKREETKKERLQQVEQARLRAQQEEVLKNRKQKEKREAEERASEQFHLHDKNRQNQIEKYVSDHYSENHWIWIVLISIIVVPFVFAYMGLFFGLVSIAVAYFIGQSGAASEKRSLRTAANEKFPQKSFEDFYVDPSFGNAPKITGSASGEAKRYPNLSQDDINVINRLKSHGCSISQFGSSNNWKVDGEVYFTKELHTYEKELLRRISKGIGVQQNIHRSLNETDSAGRGSSIAPAQDKPLQDDINAINRLKSYGITVTEFGNAWKLDGEIYFTRELHSYEKEFLKRRDFSDNSSLISAQYPIIQSSERTTEQQSDKTHESFRKLHKHKNIAVELSAPIIGDLQAKNQEEIIEKLLSHGFVVSKFASNWKIDGDIYFPHEIEKLLQKCTPQRIDALKSAPRVAHKLQDCGFSVEQNYSSWIVDGKRLSPEQLVGMEVKCTQELQNAVKKLPSVIQNMKHYGIKVEREGHCWMINETAMDPQQVVDLNPDTVAHEIRQQGVEVSRVGKMWNVEGTMLSAWQLISRYKSDNKSE